ncbi:MAG TPA: N-acyl homoserine lactonase family protein [Candidatus Limnocylindrales bacterium]|nr:N-acyl homoserine lactonase family protein [Candidatus Limnocylindrales bacterium]
MKIKQVVALILAILAISFVFSTGKASAAESAKFDKLYCVNFATLANYPLDALLFGVGRGEKVNVPFQLCLAKSGNTVVALDSGFTNMEIGQKWGAKDYVDYKTAFAKTGIKPEDVNYVTIGHAHWDHAGGTGAFPNAKFIIQTRELEFAAGSMTQNKQAKAGFEPADILNLVKLNWEGRVILVDGDVQDVIPGLSVYLTPGHTAGTQTVCLETTKGRACYTSDAVYMYRNINEDIPLGFGLNLYQMVESYKKIRAAVGNGLLIPGHEPLLYSEPEKHGFKKIDDRTIAVVE